MLFFITASPTSGSRISYSNTSHVILYLHLLLHLQRLELHSNTSHVILYPSRRRCVCFCFAFKYISCYSLSKVFQNGTYLAQNSNTSHVILYQGKRRETTGEGTFKYISCYSLSSFSNTNFADVIAFKYISCYSLSSLYIFSQMCLFYSNTSHVILYPSLQASQCCTRPHSNTSHVILYLIPLFLDTIIYAYSNTSHVILYRWSPSDL